MEILSNGFTLEICDGAFPLSTDSIALSDFVRLPKNARVLDLGAGCGTIGMLLCAKDPGCCVTGIEINEKAHRMALQNANANNITDRFSSICADLCAIPPAFKHAAYDVCVSNPPYFADGPRSQNYACARQEGSCTLDTVFAAAAAGLKYGGDFFLVHKPERLAEICALGAKHHLETKRLRLLRHRQGGPVTLILVQCRKGGNPGLVWEEEFLHLPDGVPSDYYRRLYNI